VKAPSRLSVDLWWVDIPGQERAFFTSAKEAWHHAGEAAYQQVAAAQVFRGTFTLRSASIEHTGDFTAMAESFRKARGSSGRPIRLSRGGALSRPGIRAERW
jgi:hypothetical protein